MSQGLPNPDAITADRERMNNLNARPEQRCTCGHLHAQHERDGCTVYLDGGRSVCPCETYTPETS